MFSSDHTLLINMLQFFSHKPTGKPKSSPSPSALPQHSSPQHTLQDESRVEQSEESDYPFIVIKRVDSKPLYEEPRLKVFNSRLHEEIMMDAALAFGGKKKHSRRSRSGSMVSNGSSSTMAASPASSTRPNSMDEARRND